MYKHKNGTVIRKIAKADLPILLELKQGSWWGTHTSSIINEEDQEKWYQSIPNNTLVLIALVEEVVSAVSILSEIDWINRSSKISGSVIESQRKKAGVVQKCCEAEIDFAFEMLNLHRLDAEVLEYNFVAQRYEIGFLGFVPEGRRRKAVYKCGSYYDSIVLGLLRSDWEKDPRVADYKGSCNLSFDPQLIEKMSDRAHYHFLENV